MNAFLRSHRRRLARGVLVVPLALLLVCLALSTAVVSAPRALAAAPADCLGPVAGQYIYDCTGLLTSSETATLQQDAAAVEKAGARTIVYLQVKSATAQQTWQDAVDLMTRWDVESKPGARDGFVMLFNLQPGNLRHGQVALFAGEKYYHSTLPQDELDRIRSDIMTPLLANGQTAAGIAAGLQQVASDLTYGPPPPPPAPRPSATQLGAATFGRIPYNVLAVIFAAIVGFLLSRERRRAPLSSAGDEVGGLTVPATPGELAPGIVGALIRGRVSDAQMEATILDFARRGLLVMEPEGAGLTRLRLTGTGAGLQGYERDLWDELAHRAGSKSRVISSTGLAHLRHDWGDARQELRRELIERGWFDPAAASRRRRPFFVAAWIGVVWAAAGVMVAAIGHEGWALLGAALVGAVSIAAVVFAERITDTTVEGTIAAAHWRAYRASVEDRSYEPNLDTDLPYIVAMGIVDKLAPRLKAASERGYAPSWFHAKDKETQGTQDQHPARYGMMPYLGFYPYWMAFHSVATPQMSSGSAGGFGGSFGGGFSGGGAAGGGGGSAGGF